MTPVIWSTAERDVTTSLAVDVTAKANDTTLNHSEWQRAPAAAADVIVTVATGLTILCVILLTIVGNSLVIAAVICFRRLRSVTNNYFVVSLAVADLTVAVLVMPFAALFELRDTSASLASLTASLQFGWRFCYFWTSCDVTCCTASILHLCVVAVDRYLSVAEFQLPRARIGLNPEIQDPSEPSCASYHAEA